MKAFLVVVAALGLAGCSDVTDSATELKARADAAIDEKALVDAATSAVDLDAAKAQAQRSVNEAVQEVLPSGELAAIGAVVDEAALVDGVDKAINGDAIGDAVRDAVTGNKSEPIAKPVQ